MSFLDEIKRAANNPVANYIQFLQNYNIKDNSLHLFLEGDDDPSFYTAFIERVTSGRYKLYFYKSKNKDGVYRNYAEIDWRIYNKNRVLFFVDKDYSDILNLSYPVDENIFVTSYYSIENYIVNEYILEKILRELIGIGDIVMARLITDKFVRLHSKYSNLIMLVSSWIIFHRSIGTNINLNNINLRHIFTFNSEFDIIRVTRPNAKKLLKYLDEKTKTVTPEGSWKHILGIYRQLAKIDNKKMVLRGKYEVWFLIEFCNNLLIRLNEGKSSGETKYKLKVALSEGNAVQVLGARLPIPEDLEEFLRSNISKM